MRTFLVTVIILAILISCFTVSTLYLKSVSEKMLKFEKQIENNIVGYEETYNKMQNYWNKNQKLVMAVCNHKICDDISVSIKRLGKYLQSNGIDKYAELAALQELTRNMYKTEKLNLSNIF